ncbi:hypothetical protein [Caballeronia insecticola]|uniref:hypothetical protein n=1 Tax=Caballeronia insecticola TaxID=758793 RepID=UPI0005C660F3|nr:hypothetical protein [Caballeronia insecticola]
MEALHKDAGNESHLASMMKLTLTTMIVSNSTGLKVRAQVFREAREGIVRCRRSGRNTGKWNLDQTTYKSLCEVVAAFDRQLNQAPFYEFMLADEEMTALLARRDESRAK